jgi:hypothetical protein
VEVRAACLAAPLEDLARCSADGRVLAAFERSVYLEVEGRIIAALWPRVGRGPFAISLADPVPLDAIPADAGVLLDAGRLQIGGITVVLTGAPLWDPSLSACAAHAELRSPLEMESERQVVADALERMAPAESVAGILAPRASRSGGAHAKLLAAFERGLEAIRAYVDGGREANAAADAIASEIAGRGPGLTPSGDDLLVGILHAVSVWPSLAGRRGPAALRALLHGASAPRTTRISRAYLEAAARGWATEPWHALVRGLAASGDAGDDARSEAVRKVVRVGETSGADALTGFCWAWSRLDANRRPGAFVVSMRASVLGSD